MSKIKAPSISIEEATKPCKAVSYRRVSSIQQRDLGFSLDAQEELHEKYAKERNLEIVQVFEEAKTAKKAGRVEFNKMVKFFKSQEKLPPQKRVRILLIEKVDRLSRNFKDIVVVDDLMKSMCLELHAVRDRQIFGENSSPSEKLMFDMQVAMAKNYIENLRLEVKKGMYRKASQGLHPTKAPLGYRNATVNNQKVIVPDELYAPYIRRIFELMASGKYSIKSLALKISEEGMRTKKGKMISKSHLQHILGNHTHYGMVDYGDSVIVKGQHQGIIDEDLFLKAQQVMLGRTSRFRGLRKYDWAFQGLMTCGHCGCSVVGERKKNRFGSSYVYYHCTGNRGKCPEKYASEAQVAKEFGRALAQIQMDEGSINYVQQALLASHGDKMAFQKTTQDALILRQETLQRQIDGAWVDSLNGVVEKDEFIKKRAEWRNEQRMIEERLAQIRVVDDSYLQAGQQVLELVKSVSQIYESLDLEKKRELVGIVCSNSTWKDGKLTPTFHKPFDFIAQFNQNKNAAPALEGTKSGVSEVWLAD